MQTKHFVAFALAVGLVIGVGVWLLVAPKEAAAPSTTATSTTTTLANGVGVETSGQATISDVSSAPTPPATPKLTFAASMNLSDEAKSRLQAQWDTLTSELKAQPSRVDLWLSLGTTYKIAGQYQGSIDCWTYVAKYGPSSINYVAWGNLGDLYLNFVQDYPNAKVAYQQALKGAPNNPDYQAGLKAAQSHL